jgi:hypothetical protein
MKIVIHQVFDEELMIPAVVAFKDFKSPAPELKYLVMLRLRISRSLDTISKESFPVQVRVSSIQIIGCGLICGSMRLEVDCPSQFMRESAPLSVMALATLKVPTGCLLLIALPKAVGSSSAARIATGSPFPAVSHNDKSGSTRPTIEGPALVIFKEIQISLGGLVARVDGFCLMKSGFPADVSV